MLYFHLMHIQCYLPFTSTHVHIHLNNYYPKFQLILTLFSELVIVV